MPRVGSGQLTPTVFYTTPPALSKRVQMKAAVIIHGCVLIGEIALRLPVVSLNTNLQITNPEYKRRKEIGSGLVA